MYLKDGVNDEVVLNFIFLLGLCWFFFRIRDWDYLGQFSRIFIKVSGLSIIKPGVCPRMPLIWLKTSQASVL